MIGKLIRLGLNIAPKITKTIARNPKGVLQGAKKALSTVPAILLENGRADTFVKSATAAARNVIKKDGTVIDAMGSFFKNGFKSVYKDVEQVSKTEGGIFKRCYTKLKGIPTDLTKAIEEATKGKTTLRGKAWGTTKGIWKGLGKTFPLWLNLMFLGFEIPNIISATKDNGVISGGTEAGKSVARLTGATIGASLLSGIPLIGPILGWMFGERLVSTVLGKSHSEKVAEKEKEYQNAMALLQQSGYNIPTGQSTVPLMQQNSYGLQNDIMYQRMLNQQA